MATAVLSRWTRRFLVVGVVFLVASQLAALAGLPRRTELVCGLYGFVLTVAFGKAYTLVPAYFDRTLVVPRAPAVHLGIQVVAVTALALAPVAGAPPILGRIGPVAWAAGVVIFASTIGATVATNPLGRETGTSEANQKRAGLDSLANPFMPVAVAYLLVGTYAQLAPAVGLPVLFDGSPVRASHLLAAGFALLLLLSVGYRLLPRFLVGSVPRVVATPVLLAGAIGPALLAVGYPSGPVFKAGAVLVSVAVVGFAGSYLRLFYATDRGRVGFYGPLFGVLLGVGGVALGAWFAFVGIEPELVGTHLRLNVFGLLGLSILGVVFQFYPPAVSQWPGDGDRLARLGLGLVAAGVATAAIGPVVVGSRGAVGHAMVAVGGGLVAYLLVGAIWSRTH